MIFFFSAWSLIGRSPGAIKLEEPPGRFLDRQLLLPVVRDEDVDRVDPLRERMTQLLRDFTDDGRGQVALKPLDPAVRPGLWRDAVGVVMSQKDLELLEDDDQFGDDLRGVHGTSSVRKAYSM